MDEQTPGGTTHTPPDPAAQTASDRASGPDHEGPRVSASEVRDLGRLRRTRDDKYVAGVAGGLARHLDIDPVILRVAFVVLTFFGGAGIIVYGACWLLVPQDGSDRAAFDLDIRSRTIALIGAGALAGLALIGDAFGGGPGGWVAWPLVVIGLIAWLVMNNRDRRREARAAAAGGASTGWTPAGTPTDWTAGSTAFAPTTSAPYGSTGPAPYGAARSAGPAPYRPRDPRKRGPILFWFTLALVALSIGVLGIADTAGAPVTDSAYPALALGIIAAALLVGAFIGRAGGLIPIGLIAVVGLAGATAAQQFDGSTMHRTPTSAADVRPSYDVGTGELVLDLTKVTDLEGLDGRMVQLDGSLGSIEVRVPDGLDVSVDASVSAGGEIRAFGEKQEGWNFSLQTDHDGGVDVPTLHLGIDLTFGEILVVNR